MLTSFLHTFLQSAAFALFLSSSLSLPLFATAAEDDEEKRAAELEQELQKQEREMMMIDWDNIRAAGWMRQLEVEQAREADAERKRAIPQARETYKAAWKKIRDLVGATPEESNNRQAERDAAIQAGQAAREALLSLDPHALDSLEKERTTTELMNGGYELEAKLNQYKMAAKRYGEIAEALRNGAEDVTPEEAAQARNEMEQAKDALSGLGTIDM